MSRGLLTYACVSLTMAGLTALGVGLLTASLMPRLSPQLAGVVEGQELARMFAWMRPNDLIWNYWVNNYLLGNRPPAFDVLAWNADSTNLPAGLHADFLTIALDNALANPGSAISPIGLPLWKYRTAPAPV